LFYDGTGNVVEIRVGHTEAHVTSLQFIHALDGVHFEGRRYGGGLMGDTLSKVSYARFCLRLVSLVYVPDSVD
jgi:hypothetical protein